MSKLTTAQLFTVLGFVSADSHMLARLQLSKVKYYKYSKKLACNPIQYY